MKIYDSRKVVTGLILALCLLTSPFWYNIFFGRPKYLPELKVERINKCVREASYMRKNHMKLLDLWRDSVVRKNERLYLKEDGKEYKMSLSGTCLGCHKEKEAFCDRCHGYIGVTPKCFRCHVVPKG
ncbi:MAG: sulfate reduction electron transfer complex DsrMKJOP subunit DsrJ [Desulfobacterota bacterium]|nr:sulfate reduction electron transfer complex DsrMKJOP subunit DsrJ [Thermodesulfobacteriota bacterium]MDW8001226.1 sulfate reduction electron transfer complex DsrMKJOP subunit DsrJ [Deltaproteobacteria bacterium]